MKIARLLYFIVIKLSLVFPSSLHCDITRPWMTLTPRFISAAGGRSEVDLPETRPTSEKTPGPGGGSPRPAAVPGPAPRAAECLRHRPGRHHQASVQLPVRCVSYTTHRMSPDEALPVFFPTTRCQQSEVLPQAMLAFPVIQKSNDRPEYFINRPANWLVLLQCLQILLVK